MTSTTFTVCLLVSIIGGLIHALISNRKIRKSQHDQISHLIKMNEKVDPDPEEVLQIVLTWYTDGSFPDNLHDEYGRDLEEICEMEIERHKRTKDVNDRSTTVES